MPTQVHTHWRARTRGQEREPGKFARFSLCFELFMSSVRFRACATGAGAAAWHCVFTSGARAERDALMSFTERFWKVFDREIRIGTSVYVT